MRNSLDKVAENTNRINTCLKYGWEGFLTLRLSKVEVWKSIIKIPKNGVFQRYTFIVLRGVPCLYFILTAPIFIIKYSDGIKVISIRLKIHSEGFVAKSWVNF